MKKIILLFLFCHLFLWAVAQTEGGRPFVRNFLSKQYKAGASNWAVVQDLRGIMYFGNDNGILEFDGVSWALIKTNGLAVRSLAVDDKGRVFVGGTGTFGYLAVDSTGKPTYKSIVPANVQRFNEVWTVNCLKGQTIFQTNKNLWLYDGKKVENIEPPSNPAFFSFAYKIENDYYVQQDSVGLLKFDRGSFALVKGTERLANSLMTQVLPYPNKKMLICSQDFGLFIADGTSVVPLLTEADAMLRKFRLYSAYQLTDGNYVIGTLGGGAVVINPNGKVQNWLNESNGIADDMALAFASDKQNGLWVALYNGISRIEYPSPITVFSEEYHGLKGSVNAVIRHKNDFFACTMQGLLRLQNGKFVPVANLNVDCWALLSIENDLLIASYDGVKRLAANNSLIEISNTRPQTLCLARSKADTNRVFAGTDQGVRAFYKKGNSWTDEGKLEGIDREVRAIVEDEKGFLWISSRDGGIARASFQDGFNFSPNLYWFNIENGLPASAGNHVFLFDGEVKAATAHGIYHYQAKDEKFVPDPQFDEPFNRESRRVVSPSVDDDGNLWAFSMGHQGKREIGYWTKKSNNTYQYTQNALARLNDLQAVGYIFTEKNGTIWFSDIENLFRYDSRANVQKNYQYDAFIRKVSIGAKDSVVFGGAFADADQIASLQQPDNQILNFNYSFNNIRFDFSAADYNDDKNVVFEHFLENFQTDWSMPSQATFKEFTNLPEGSYVFRVRAKNLYGQTSREAVYKFSIAPPWYRWLGMRILYVMLLGLGVWLFVKWRLSMVEKEKEILEQKVEEKTSELRLSNEQLYQINEELRITFEQIQEQNKHIEKQRDQIFKQKENIESSIRYARRIQDAILPYEIKVAEAFQDYFIYYKPRDIVSGDFYWYSEKSGKKIIMAIDCTGHGVPGAFMSMIGFSLLTQVISEKNITNSDLILNELHEGVFASLKQSDNHNKDGMDMAVCVIDPQTNTLEYSGAKNPLFIFQNGEFREIKADKNPIGGSQEDYDNRKFTRHVIPLDQPTTIYMFTDGYQDQFGGKDGKKFMIKNFRDLIQHIKDKPMAEQKEILTRTMDNWAGEHDQVDDILVVGVKIS